MCIVRLVFTEKKEKSTSQKEKKTYILWLKKPCKRSFFCMANTFLISLVPRYVSKDKTMRCLF